MEWWMAFTIIVGALCALMVIGMPIAFAFLAVNIAGAYFFWGGVAGLNQMVLAVMLPPSALGVILAATANLSVGEFLLSIIVPGLMMAASYAIYVVARCTLQPDIAPIYSGGPKQPLKQKLRDTVVYVFPLATIIFVVTGLIFLGIATPTESAGLGALSA